MTFALRNDDVDERTPLNFAAKLQIAAKLATSVFACFECTKSSCIIMHIMLRSNIVSNLKNNKAVFETFHLFYKPANVENHRYESEFV